MNVPFGQEWFTRHMEVLWWLVADPPFYYLDDLIATGITLPEGLLISRNENPEDDDAPYIGYRAADPEALMAWYTQKGLVTPEQIERFRALWTLWQMDGE